MKLLDQWKSEAYSIGNQRDIYCLFRKQSILSLYICIKIKISIYKHIPMISVPVFDGPLFLEKPRNRTKAKWV